MVGCELNGPITCTQCRVRPKWGVTKSCCPHQCAAPCCTANSKLQIHELLDMWTCSACHGTSEFTHLLFSLCSSWSPPFPRDSSSLTHWWWVDEWLSAYCHAWRLLEEQKKKKHQDTHFHWDHEHMNYAETMFHCYFGGHRIKHTKFCSSIWSPCILFYSSGKGAHADGHIREGKQLDNWMDIRCGIPGMF